MTKVYFPREIFPFSAVLVSLVDFAVGSAVLVGLMIWYQVPVGLNLAWFPIVLAVHVLFTAAIALVLSMANLFYRDVKYLFEVVIGIWMFATSVLYPLDKVEGFQGTLLQLNPMTPIIDAYRDVILLNTAPGVPFAVVAAATVGFLGTAWLCFHRLEFKFAESI